MLSNSGWVMAMGSASFEINNIKDTKNGSRKDKPSDKESNNGSRDSHDYLFIPRMTSEPFNDFLHNFLDWWSRGESNPYLVSASDLSYR